MHKPLTSAKILSDNLRAVTKTGGARSVRAWAGDATLARSISRIIRKEQSPTVELLDEIAAKAGNLSAWHLLLPNLGPTNPPVVTITEHQRAMFSGIKKAFAELPPLP